MRRPFLALPAAVFCLIAAPAPAAGELRFGRCPGGSEVGERCARLAVPLDRDGATAGRIGLHVERLRARRARGVVVALSGGPGQSAAADTAGFALVLEPVLRDRDLVVFDQRGTGRSGVLRCNPLQRANLLDAGAQAAACAERLGPARAHYTTRDSVEDLEALRAELGVPRLSLYGVSYGTKLALAYAQAHPDRVDRLVLDSVVDVAGPDPFYRESYAAARRVLRQLCSGGGCRGTTRDPVSDLGALVARLPLGGSVVGIDGRRRRAVLTGEGLFTALVAGDFDPSLRGALPGAVRAALAGDLAPVLRLVSRARRQEGEFPRVAEFSVALYAATVCEETRFPWPRDAAFGERRGYVERALAGEPDEVFTPFDRRTALESDVVKLCERWPAAASDPGFVPAPPPDVPVLALAGDEDVRTPLETASRVAAAFPRGVLVRVRGVGHSVLGSDLSGCAERAVVRFFRGRTPGACRGRPPLETEVEPVPPRSISDLRPVHGVRGRAGRTLAAVELTFTDLVTDLVGAVLAGRSRVIRLGGLRGGRARLDDRRLELVRYEYVPGVRLDGGGAFDGAALAIRVSGRGAASGSLRFTERGISGRLGRTRIRVRTPVFDDEALATAARARRAAAVR